MNNLTIVNTVLLAAILILGLTGNFGGGKGGSAAAPTPTPAPTAAPTPTPQPVAAVTTIPTAEVKAFYDNAYIEGDADAKISVIEFSDVECPFCQRHTNAGTLDQVRAKYGEDVNVVFAHFPLSIHPNAQKAGEALECAGKLEGEEGFFAFKKALFAKGGKPTLDVIEATATEQGINAADMMACVNGGEFAQKVTDQMAFGRKLGVTGTPGNIVMNNETGEFTKVSGAVPATAFDAAIMAYLN